MALIKPGFYFLAQHGPWVTHVKFKNEAKALEAMDYLAQQGHKINVDYEMIYEPLGNQKGETKSHKMPTAVVRRVMPTIMAPNNIQGVSPMTGPAASINQLRTAGAKRTAIIFFKDPKIAAYVKLSYG